MLIFLHGTGDDCSKPDNWMAAVARIMREKFGEIVLVLPGVNSGQNGLIGTRTQECLDAIDAAKVAWTRRPATPKPDVAGLTAALAGGRRASSMLRWTASNEVPDDIPAGQERAVAQRIAANLRSESGLSAIGVKPRMSFAACCALAYYRAGGPNPIRIIGHSRGGASAVGAHNLISSFGVPCDHTLTLDPCHGLHNGLKDYYTKIWLGHLENMPCKKGVAFDWIESATERPPITQMPGASVTQHTVDELAKIKHGHMGKLKSMPGGADKESARTRLRGEIDIYISGLFTGTAVSVLEQFFAKFADTDGEVGADRAKILERVVHFMTAGRTLNPAIIRPRLPTIVEEEDDDGEDWGIGAGEFVADESQILDV